MSDRDALRDAIADALKRLPYADVIVPDDAWAGDYADAAIAAIEAAGVRLVPAEATEDQFRAGSAFRMAAETHGYRDTEGLYLAMIAASPYAAEETGGE